MHPSTLLFVCLCVTPAVHAPATKYSTQDPSAFPAFSAFPALCLRLAFTFSPLSLHFLMPSLRLPSTLHTYHVCMLAPERTPRFLDWSLSMFTALLKFSLYSRLVRFTVRVLAGLQGPFHHASTLNATHHHTHAKNEYSRSTHAVYIRRNCFWVLCVYSLQVENCYATRFFCSTSAAPGSVCLSPTECFFKSSAGSAEGGCGV